MSGKAWLLAAALLLLVACENPPEPPLFIEAGDLAEIQARGQLRILYPRRHATGHLPRKGVSLDFEREIAEAYAHEMNLEPVWIFVDSRDDLIPWLLGGKGDLVAANLTVTEPRKRRVEFTVPLTVVREQLIARAGEPPIRDAAELVGRRIAVRRSSSFWATIEGLRQRHPGIEVDEVPGHFDTEELIHRVALGEYDLTVADSNLVQACLDYREDVVPALDLTRSRSIAWAVRPNSPELLRSLNRFLTELHLTDRGDELLTDDFNRIKKRKVLRLLTRNTSSTYFLWRGQLMGFEYELIREFARQHGLRLEVIVPPRREDLLVWLREGRGDIVSAALTPDDRLLENGVAFSEPYDYVSQMIVTRTADPGLRGPAELAGRTIHVRRSSSYWDTLEQLRDLGVSLTIEPVPEDVETEEIIARVGSGEYDLTVADSHMLNIELTWRDDVRAAFAIRDEIPLSWAVRESNTGMKSATDFFLRREYRGLLYNVIYAKYFEDTQKILRHLEERVDTGRGLSPYDEIVKRYAEEYEFDWRLIVSQMYQESRFNPGARSFAGAEGLMQVLPRTARELGFDNVGDPEIGIHAGIKYMDWVRDRFEEELSVRDRTWFTLAAYNAGPGHVRDARRLAAREGLDPNRWFGNVEQAMLLLSRDQYAGSARHGYCRCWEPVRYVREIRERYNAYVGMLGS